MALKLVVGNKNYSSWSFRPWLALAAFGIPFEEVVVPLFASDAPSGRDRRILRHSPAGKVPVLVDGDLTVWDSLAILEYLAEKFPEKPFWPKTRAARARARSMAAEMHSGFPALRQEMPMNMRRAPKVIALSDAARRDVERIAASWVDARRANGGKVKGAKGGPFLFGKFGAVDAMYAPVVARFDAYGVELPKPARDYAQAVRSLPAYRAWVADAAAEPWRIERVEVP